MSRSILSPCHGIFRDWSISRIPFLLWKVVPYQWRSDVNYFLVIRELKQPRRRRQQKPHKFAYLTMKNRIFALFPRAFFSYWHFEDVLVLSTTSSDLFSSCLDDVSIWLQMFNFLFLCPKRWFQFNSRIVRTHFSNIMTLNNWKMIAEREVTFSDDVFDSVVVVVA